MRTSKRVIFVSTPHTEPWSGAEELWTRTALDLVSQGYAVSASVTEFSPPHPRMLELEARGVEFWLRKDWYSWPEHPWRRLRALGRNAMLYAVERLLRARSPALVVFSEGNGLPPIE